MWHHTHLDVAGDAKLRFYSLFHSSSLFKLIVCHFQLFVSYLQTSGGTMTVEDKDGECQDYQYKHDGHTNKSLMRQRSFLLSYLTVFLLSFIDSSQLGSIVILLPYNSRIQSIEYSQTNSDGRVAITSSCISTILRENILLDNIESRFGHSATYLVLDIGIALSSLSISA